MAEKAVKIYARDDIEYITQFILSHTKTFCENSTQLIDLATKLSLNVFHAEFKDNDIAGMLKIENDKYNIYVNQEQPIERQRFTIAHEIAHFILHKDLINAQRGSILYRKDFTSSDPIEKQANFFAAALLMPKDEIEKAWNNLKSVEAVAGLFKTSKEATYRRLDELKKL